MRFITEFELPKYYDKSNEAWGSFNLERKKSNLECGIGVQIANNFGWQNPNQNELHYKLEIEAFPMEKWIEFKNKLFEHIVDTNHMVSGTHILQMIKDLEFYGKPSGDAITNQK